MKFLRHWVNGYKEQTFQNEYDYHLDFELFDDDDGFGLSEVGSFNGTIRVLSPTISATREVRLGVFHSARFGAGLTVTLHHGERLPAPPFLLTNDFETKQIYAGNALVLDQPQEASQLAYCLNRTLPIGTKNWFGALTVLAASEPFQCHLIAFGNDPDEILDSPMVVKQLDVDKPFGTLVIPKKIKS